MNLGDLEKIVAKFSTTKLKDLIKSIRNCKTAADERAVIAKESASIRTAFKEESYFKKGHPAHFGQIECLKLVASPRFSDKRLGYLGTMLLLDENQQVLTLVTNCIKNDLNNSNMFIASLALCTLGNISSSEMARDLVPEVEKLLSHSNSYIRKKAALCALRIIKKESELLDNFVSKALNLLNERNHGVLLTGVTLLIEMCVMSNEVLNSVRKVQLLLTFDSSPEHDVGGITDPFLQVKILKLLGMIGKGDAESSDIMNDILAQVATNTDSSKNVGNAILYETVLTIMEIQGENSLRVLGINILGKFLTNKDNNIRYVALTTLAKTAQASVSSDATALQRHRITILDCLKDSDISIRRRALDLSFHLINSQNIRLLTRELLCFLEICEEDAKESLSSRICDIAGLLVLEPIILGRYRPNKRWELDTIIRVLRVAGAYVEQSVVNYFVKLVSTGPQPLLSYTVRKLYGIITNEGDKAIIQEGLLQVTLWCIGEYGDFLVSNNNNSSQESLFGQDEEEKPDSSFFDYSIIVTEREVVTLIDKILKGPYASILIKEYAVCALSKLTARFKDESVILMIKNLFTKYTNSIELELQQRSIEVSVIWGFDKSVRESLLERVPILESALIEESRKGTGAPIGNTMTPKNPLFRDTDLLNQVKETSPNQDLLFSLMGDSQPQSKSNGNDILGLMGGLVVSNPQDTLNSQSNSMMNDLLGIQSHSNSNPIMNDFNKPTNSQSMMNDLLGIPTKPINSPRVYSCFNKHQLEITLTPQPKPMNQSFIDILITFHNRDIQPIESVLFQVAVTKSLKLMMQPASNTCIKPHQTETQQMRIDNPMNAPIKLRLKVSFLCGSGNVEEIQQFEGFDPLLWSQ